MRYFIFLLIVLFSFSNNIYGLSSSKENFNLNLDVESNFISLFNSNSLFQVSFSNINLNKTNYFILGNNELSFKFKEWEISYFYQIEFLGKINNSTKEFIQKLSNKEFLPIGENYDIFFNLEGFNVIGGKILKKFSFRNILFTFSPKILYGLDIQRGKIFGNFVRLDEKSFQFNLFLDYMYNHNYLYKRKDLKLGKGLGFSFDLDISFKLFDNFLIILSFQDLYGKIYWKDIPFTEADATTEREYYDEYGNIVYRPFIKGYEGYKDYIQNIPLKIKFFFEYNLYSLKLNFDLNYVQDFYFYNIKISYPLSSIKSLFFLNSTYKINTINPTELGFIISGDNLGIHNIFYYFSYVL